MKRLKRPNSLFLQGEVSSAVLKTWKTRETKTRITQNFQILNHIQGASFHSVPKKDKKNSATSSWIFSCYPPPLSKWMKRKLLPVAGKNPATDSQIFSCYQHLVTRKKAIGNALDKLNKSESDSLKI